MGVIVSNVSSAGKSHEVDVVLKLVPPEDVLDLTSMSPQALIYKEQGSLSHKVIRIAEHIDNDANQAMYLYLRELLSKGELSRDVAMKSADGQISTVTMHQKGPIALIETTTKNAIHPENMTRMWLLRVDESEEQTRRIHEAQRAERTLAQFELDEKRKAIIRRHHVAQRLLEPLAVVIPDWWQGALEFPSGLVRTRRDHSQFLDLIAACALLHQKQRPIHEHAGRRYILALFRDYELAARMATRPLQSSLLEVEGPARELYDAIAAAVKDGKLVDDECSTFTRRQICEALKPEWGRDRIEKHIRTLEDAGLLYVMNERRQGVQREYSLVEAEVAAGPVLPSGVDFRGRVIAGLIRRTRSRAGGLPTDFRGTSDGKLSP